MAVVGDEYDYSADETILDFVCSGPPPPPVLNRGEELSCVLSYGKSGGQNHLECRSS